MRAHIPAAPPGPSPVDDAIWARIVRSPASSPIIRAILTNSSLAEFKPIDGFATISCSERYAPGAKARVGEIAQVFEKELGRRFTVHVLERGSPASAPAAPAPAPPAPAPAPRSPAPGEAPRASASAAASAAPAGAAPAPATEPAPAQAPGPAFNAAEDPLVRQALELFSARIVSVQPR